MGGTHAYRIALQTGQFFHIIVDQRGVDVVVRLCSPEGKELSRSDSPNGAFGPEPLSFIAANHGTYQLEVRVPDKEAPAGRYEAALTALRDPTSYDKSRITAEREFMRAVELMQSQSPGTQQDGSSFYTYCRFGNQWTISTNKR